MEFQNFKFHFLVGGGGQKINMFGYDEIMVIFGAFWGVISIHLGFFLRSRYRFWKMCLGLPYIPYIFGGKEKMLAKGIIRKK